MWYKVIVSTQHLADDMIDLVSYRLFEIGGIGVEVDYAEGYLENHPNLFGELAGPIPKERLEHPLEIIAYFEKEPKVADIEALVQDVMPLDYVVTVDEVEDEDWQSNWMVHYQPQQLSRYLTIVPIWEQYEAREGEQCIYIDPGLAFGTGNHPTTQLGAQALELVLRGGERVIDVGTGSGILAFIAERLGSQYVAGYDLDPQAIESAQQNLQYQYERHAVRDSSEIVFEVNDLLQNVTTSADVIVANILPHILVQMLDDAYKLLTDDGYLILGGILDEKALEIEVALARHDFVIEQKTMRQGWVGYIAKKKIGEA